MPVQTHHPLVCGEPERAGYLRQSRLRIQRSENGQRCNGGETNGTRQAWASGLMSNPSTSIVPLPSTAVNFTHGVKPSAIA